MPALNEASLKDKLRENPVGVYLLYGEESYLKKTYIDKIVSKTVDSAFEDFNFHTFDGKEVVWDLQQWKQLLASAQGDSISFSSEIRLKGGKKETIEWEVYVSGDKIDPYLSYRLIEPGYEVWHEVEIRERCIENFEERAISDWKNTNNSCMNCHIHSQARADLSMFYVRGKNGGAFLNRNGEVRKLSLNDKSLISGTVYGEIHPSGRYGVFSTNIIIPGFHTQVNKRLEVYDTRSDLVIADFDRNELKVLEILENDLSMREKLFENTRLFAEKIPCIFCRRKQYILLCRRQHDLAA